MSRAQGKVKQAQLTFAPVASPSPTRSEHSPGDSPGRFAKLRYNRPFKSFLRRGPRIDDYLTRREDLSSDFNATPKRSAEEEYPITKQEARQGVFSDDDNTSMKDSQLTITGNSSPGRSSKSKSDRDVSSDEDTIMVTTRSQQRNKARATDDEVSDVSAGRGTNTKGKRMSPNINGYKKKPKEKPSRSSHGCRSPRVVIERNVTGSDKTRGETSTARQSEVSNLPSEESAEPTPPRKSPQFHSTELDSPETSDADEIATRPTRRLRRGPAQKKKEVAVVDEPESEEEPVMLTPVKRRRINTDVGVPQTPRQTSEQEKLDLEEDLQDLQDSVVKETRTRGRPTNSARQKRQQQLEALRRRRVGERTQNNSGSEPESENSETRKSESRTYGPRWEYLDVTDVSDVEPAIPGDENLDRYEDDFVLQDDEATLGVPTEMPFEFSRHAYKQPKEYFRDVVEWMVHNKLNPAFPRSDALYEVAFIKLEDEVKGRVGSQFVSTVWTSSFHRALMARPHIEVTLYPVRDGRPCDACNRAGHQASFDVRLHGKAYSLQTLDPVSDEDSDEDDERDTVERDRNGNVIPDENTRFLLGRHCKTKATMAHTLCHWRYHLYEWVVDHLARQGILTDANILERSHWSVKKQTKYANEVVDMMDRSAEIQKLWRDFHITLRTARETPM